MSVSNKDVALSIIHFLKASVANNQVQEDYAESMEVAIDCIADAFEVSKDGDSAAVEAKFGGKSLPELLQATTAGSATKADVKIDLATQAQADQLKLEGNREMAAKRFPEAISKYTEAIALDPKNVVYLSNRAAAYSLALQHQKAVEDLEKAISLDPNFSKAYSRLGLAKYALGDATAAMNAYKKGLEVEGDKKSDAMKRGYETAKRRVEEDLEKAIPSTEVSQTEPETARAAPGAGAGGMPDFSSMFGSGGMPSLSDMMNNPQVMQAAQQMMQNPGALEGLMNNPAIRQMAQSMGVDGGAGGTPDFSSLMNNPMLRNMASQFMGGSGPGGQNNGSGASGENSGSGPEGQ